jgi:hypothetical protein
VRTFLPREHFQNWVQLGFKAIGGTGHLIILAETSMAVALLSRDTMSMPSAKRLTEKFRKDGNHAMI